MPSSAEKEPPINPKAEVSFHAVEVDCTYWDGIPRKHQALIMAGEDGEILLHWANTRVFMFDGETIYDHIEISFENGQAIALQIDENNMPIVDFLHENGYEFCHPALPDPETQRWALAVQREVGALAIEEFLENFGGFGQEIDRD